MPARWTLPQARRAATASPWTKELRHLEPLPKHWSDRRKVPGALQNVTRPKDRIKWWNIVPGDQVKIRNSRINEILEVAQINKLTNMVYLKGRQNQEEYEQVHYSKLQLFLGEREFPPARDSDKPRTVPVFAKRLGTSAPVWNKEEGRFDWERFAAATEPPIPGRKKTESRMNIPWPRESAPSKTEPSAYDTLAEDVLEITYQPAPLPELNESVKWPNYSFEKPYIASLFNPKAQPYDPSAPVETHLNKELSNRHSRAKKQARWQARRTIRRAAMQEYIDAEVKNLGGRSVKEARVDGIFKWNEWVRESEKQSRKMRWRDTWRQGRKKLRKIRKQRRDTERLRKLVLEPGPNQFIPPDVETA